MTTLTKNLIKNYDLICVVGPTASGKSELAVKLAKKYNGEIISADSRQIYRGLNIGSGKVEGQWKTVKNDCGMNSGVTTGTRKDKRQAGVREVFVYKSIPHYLIDEASPRIQYSVAKFQLRARATIADIIKRGKMPIICGGTGQWIDAVVYDNNFPQVKPDKETRAMLSQLSKEEMFTILKRLDPHRAAEIDKNNPHRLIRALEIVMTTGKPVPKLSGSLNNATLNNIQSATVKPTFKNYKVLWLGLNPDMKTLEKNISKRLTDRMKIGMLKEVDKLHKPTSQGGAGLSWKKLEAFGLEYKYCALFLENKIPLEDLQQGIIIATRQYAKRQLTWWKRNPVIHWSTNPNQLLALAKKHLF